jgi:hypothetical protein
MDKVAALRKKHPIFLYENFNYKQEGNSLIIFFSFKIYPDIEFNPKITIENIDNKIFSKLDSGVLDNFIFNLGLIEMISYWKATCSPKIEIKAGSLNQQQKIWWENLLIKGLGEFFYQNKINFKQEKFIEIESESSNKFLKDISQHQALYLILNSGGRDSAVTLEVLRELKKEGTILMLNPTLSSQELASLSQIGNNITVTREIDSRLLELNSKGYLNGHTPFSAYLAFLSLLCALILNHEFIIVSNERSANEENVEFLGEKINHQYSKSFEFEKEFREYVGTNLSGNIKYLSLLRPLYEFQISKIFSNYPKYFSAFKSCNKAQKDNTWCGECPKCLSTYITLYPFINAEQSIKIFHKDLYASKELADLLLHITGVKLPKPFECVGTYEELQEGLRLSIKKLEGNNQPLPFLLRYAKEKVLNENYTQSKILTSWNQNNFLPNDLAQTLKAKIANEN